MEFRVDPHEHGVRKPAEIIAEIGSVQEYDHLVERSTFQHHKRYYNGSDGGRSSVGAQRSALLNASVSPAYLAAALPAFVRFQVFRI